MPIATVSSPVVVAAARCTRYPADRVASALLAASMFSALSACGGGGNPDVTPAMQTGSASATACDSATGRVLQVGPGKTYAVPSAAAAAAQAGDVVAIAAGDYHGDVATWAVDGVMI